MCLKKKLKNLWEGAFLGEIFIQYMFVLFGVVLEISNADHFRRSSENHWRNFVCVMIREMLLSLCIVLPLSCLEY